MLFTKFTLQSLLILFLLINNFASAQDSTKVQNKKERYKNQYYISMGAFRPTISTTLQINGNRGVGAIVSLEDNLGFSANAWLFRIDGNATFTKRSGVSLTYVKLDRKQDWTADRDITIFDTTFSVGADLGIYFNTTLISASYKYNIFSQEKWDAGLSVGIRYLAVKVGVDLETNNFSDYTESVSVPAPVPVLGIFGSAFMTERLRARYNFDYFTIEVSGVRGGVLDNRFALEYYFIKNLGIGASINFLTYEVKELPLAEDFDGKIRYSLNGFSFYLSGRF